MNDREWNERIGCVEEEMSQDISPEHRLWLAVIEQTVWDAQTVRDKRVTYSNGYVPHYIKFMRMDLLRDITDPWFDVVCQNAGLDHSGVVRRINQLLGKN